jgi:putrescine:ornithine antiporter
LACLFGTLGAAVIYILSTTAIQGIVPNADLAASNGPFGLAYARMFSPVVGSIVMALAVMACLGSLLGWQFTIAQTGKSAAEERMFPSLFAKVNRMGAPLIGMVVLGVVQTGLALMTISPTLSEQFSALVNLAVVTNVIPYVVALSALMVMMKAGRVTQGVWRRNVFVAVIAMLYGVYALFASGKDAVMGGVLVLGLAYIIWGFIAPRFSPAARSAATSAAAAIALLLIASPLLGQNAQEPTTPATTRERINQAGGARFGYRTDARPFSYSDESGKPAGYAVELCQKVADVMETAAGVTTLNVQWVPLSVADGFGPVQHGQVDLLCGGDTETLGGRELVDFSIPIFPSGTGALLRADAPTRLKEILSGRPPSRPVWRAQAGQVLQVQTFAVIGGSPVEAWLNNKLKEFQLTSKVTTVDSYDAGIQQVLDRKANVFFGDRAVLLNAAAQPATAGKLVVLDRSFTYESAALALGRGDDDFRLIVDRALSRIYDSGDLRALYTKWFGEPGENTIAFFLWNALPER